MEAPPFISKHKYLIAFFVFAINIIFRCLFLGKDSFWADEIVGVAVSLQTPEQILNLQEPNPFLYIYLIHYWVDLFGISEFAFRFFSVLCMSLGGAVLFLFTLRFFNWQTAITSALLYLSLNELFYYGQEGRAYGLVMFSVITLYYFFFCLVKEKKIHFAVLSGLSMLMVFYTHYMAFFGVIFIMLFSGLFIFVIRKKSESKLKFSFKVDVKLLLLFLLTIAVFMAGIYPRYERVIHLFDGVGKSNWLGNPDITIFKICLYEFFNTENLFYIYAWSFVLLSLVLIVRKFRDEFSIKNYAFSILVGPALITVIFLLSQLSPMFLKRYVLFTLFGFIILYCYTLSEIKIKFLYKLVPFCVLLIFTFIKLQIPRITIMDYKNGVKFLTQKQKEDKNTLVINDIAELYTYYYDREVFKNVNMSWPEKIQSLEKYDIHIPYPVVVDWPKQYDFSKYKHIYYTASYEAYSDPERKVYNILKEKFDLVSDTLLPGLSISHFLNNKKDSLQTLK